MARLVKNHSTNINGLVKWLEKMSKTPEIKTITPACLSHANGREGHLIIKVSRKTNKGYKLIARKGRLVQEVYIVTKIGEEKVSEIIKKANPFSSQKKKNSQGN